MRILHTLASMVLIQVLALGNCAGAAGLGKSGEIKKIPRATLAPKISLVHASLKAALSAPWDFVPEVNNSLRLDRRTDDSLRVRIAPEDIEFLQDKLDCISRYVKIYGRDTYLEGMGIILSQQQKRIFNLFTDEALVTLLDEIKILIAATDTHIWRTEDTQVPRIPLCDIKDQNTRCEYIFTFVSIKQKIALKHTRKPAVSLSYNSKEQNLLRRLIFWENYDQKKIRGNTRGTLGKLLDEHHNMREKKSSRRTLVNGYGPTNIKGKIPHRIKQLEATENDPNYPAYISWTKSYKKYQAKEKNNEGRIAENAGDYGAAERLYLESIMASRIYLDAWKGLIDLFLKTAQIKKMGVATRQALEIIEKLERSSYQPHLMVYGRNMHAFFLLRHAMLLDRQQKPVEALRILEEAKSKKPDSRYMGRIYNFGSGIYSKMGDLENAKMWIDQAIAFNPEHAFHYIDKAGILCEQKEFNEALKEADTAIDLSPQDGRYYDAKAAIYREMGRFGKAKETIEQAIALEPESDVHYGTAASIYHKWRDFPNALRMIEKAIKLNPSGKHFNARALIYAAKGEDALAEKDILTALTMEPDNPIHNKVYNILVGKGIIKREGVARRPDVIGGAV